MGRKATENKPLTEIQERALRGLFKRYGERIRFADAKLNGACGRMADKGWVDGMSINNGGMKYSITEKGCAVIGEKVPDVTEFTLTATFHVSGVNPDRIMSKAKDALFMAALQLSASVDEPTIKPRKKK